MILCITLLMILPTTSSSYNTMCRCSRDTPFCLIFSWNIIFSWNSPWVRHGVSSVLNLKNWRWAYARKHLQEELVPLQLGTVHSLHSRTSAKSRLKNYATRIAAHIFSCIFPEITHAFCSWMILTSNVHASMLSAHKASCLCARGTAQDMCFPDQGTLHSSRHRNLLTCACWHDHVWNAAGEAWATVHERIELSALHAPVPGFVPSV